MSFTELIDAEMAEYGDSAYADHGSARDQLERFAASVAARAISKERVRITKLVTDRAVAGAILAVDVIAIINDERSNE